MDDVKTFEQKRQIVMEKINEEIKKIAGNKGIDLTKISPEEKLSLMMEAVIELEKQGILTTGNLPETESE